MKKIKIILVLIVVFLFTSCGYSQSLSDRAIIKMLFIDGENGDYKLSAMAYTSDGGEEASQADNGAIYEGKGKTIEEALQNMEKNSAKIPFYAQNELLVLGAKSKSESVTKILEYFSEETFARPNMSVFVTELSQEDLPQESKDIDTLIKGLTNITQGKGISYNYSLHIFQCRINDTGFCGYVPSIELDEEFNVKTQGFDIYKNGKEITQSDVDNMDISLLLLNKIDKCHVQYNDEDMGIVDVTILNPYINWTANEDNTAIGYLTGKFEIVTSEKIDFESNRKDYEAWVNEKILEDMEKEIKVFYESGEDIFGIYWLINNRTRDKYDFLDIQNIVYEEKDLRLKGYLSML